MSNFLPRKKQKFRLLRLRVRYFFLFLCISTPLVFYIALGVHAWSELPNKWLILLALTMTSALSGLTYKYCFKAGGEVEVDISTEFEPSNKKSWGLQEEKIWQDAKAEALRRIDLAPDLVDVLQRHPLAMADFVAEKYGSKSKLDINALEALVLVEEVSKRYRMILQDRFPFIEEITLQRVDQISRAANSDLVKSTVKYAPWVINAYQVLTNPGGKAFESVFGDVKGELLDASIKTLQLRLKQIFLFECIEVLMDLYSGRFLIANDALAHSAEFSKDGEHLNIGLEPLRIVIIGQISSGKSTLVNRLCDEIVAEVDILPTTDKLTVYEINLPSGVEIRLCDLPGLDSNPENTNMLFEQVISSDLVLWCLKATQSAKSLDQQFSKRLDKYFADPKNVSVKPPKKMGVLTHLDLLEKVAAEKKLSLDNVLKQAADYNLNTVSLDSIFMLKHNDEALKKIQTQIDYYLEEALQVQLNRRRSASMDRGFSVQFQRLIEGSKGIAKLFN